jgi:hypothetical protein
MSTKTGKLDEYFAGNVLVTRSGVTLRAESSEWRG